MVKDLRKSLDGCMMKAMDGRVRCPCGKTLLFINEDTTASALPVMCRKCGTVWLLDLDRNNVKMSLSH